MTLPAVLYFNDTRYAISDTAPNRVTGWRCLHVAEGGDWHEMSRPAVHNSESIAGVDFTRDMQLLSYELNKATLTKEKWRVVWANETAFTNEQGFDKDGDPRVDFVNGINIGAALPKVMRGIICSGSLYQGYVDGDWLVMYPGVHGIDVTKPIVSVSEVLSRGWYFHAVSADMTRASNFPQAGGSPVLIPYFLKVPTRYPLAWFERWDSDVRPDPLRFYSPK